MAVYSCMRRWSVGTFGLCALTVLLLACTSPSVVSGAGSTSQVNRSSPAALRTTVSSSPTGSSTTAALSTTAGLSTPATSRKVAAPRPSRTTYPTSAPVTVAALRTAAWSELPAAPIAARTGAVGVWTGSQMIIWGGSDGNRTYADGAAYNPATRVWTKLPAAPISGRAGADYVWTGSVLFIWGSYADRTDSVTDGAVYSPATRRWTTLPPPPHNGVGPSAAVWSGSALVLLTSPGIDPAGNGPDVAYAQSYDLKRNAWTSLPNVI